MIPYYGDYAEDDTVDMVFNTFTSDDPSASATITNFINTDVHIHKDLGTTQRNNAAGITVSVDFDGITGNHTVKIDTSDDTVAGFWVTGSEYQVRIEGTTVDGATINAWIGTFSIERAGGILATLKTLVTTVGTAGAGLTDLGGMSDGMKAEVNAECDTAILTYDLDDLSCAELMISTTIATLASQISFTLTSGSTDDDAYNNCTIVIQDASSGAQKAMSTVSDYVGVTKTVTLKYDPGVFTMATTDKVFILAGNSLKAVAMNRQLNVAADGDIGGNVDGTVATCTTNTDMRGTDNAALAATALSDAVWTNAKATFLDHSVATVDTVVDDIQTDLDNATDGLGALKTLIDTVDGVVDAILVHTNELQTDLTDGGRLDLLIDAIKACTDRVTDARATELDVGTAGKLAHSARALKTALVNKMVIKEAADGDPAGTLEGFNDSNVSLGKISAWATTDGTYTTRKRTEGFA